MFKRSSFYGIQDISISNFWKHPHLLSKALLSTKRLTQQFVCIWMAYLISEGLILLQVDIEMALKMLQILFRNFGQIWFYIRKWVGNIFLSPAPGVKQNIKDCLFLYQHFIGLVYNTCWDCRRLRVIDTMRRSLPVILDRSPMRISDKDATSISCLHAIPQ